MNNSDRYNPQYLAWRKSVLARDGYKCMRCKKRTRIQVHHIKRHADHPSLRYMINNGISLCRKCHSMMWDNEEAYELMCHTLMASNKLRQRLRKELNEET